MRILLIDARNNTAGGGRRVFEGIVDHLVPALEDRAIASRVLGPTVSRASRLPRVTRLPVLALSETALLLTVRSPKIVLVQNLKCWGTPATRRDRLRGVVARWNVRSAVHVVAAVPSTLRIVQAETGATGTAMSFGVDSAFQPARQQRCNIVGVGTVVPHKRYELLLQAFARVDSSVRRPLRIVGATPDPAYLASLRRLTVLLGIAEEVEFVGMLGLDDLVSEYQAAVCVVQSSVVESFGFSLVEGASCGAVVIATDQPSVRDLVPELGGVVVPAEPALLGDAIAAACRSEVVPQKEAPTLGWATFASDLAQLIDERLFDRRVG